MSESKGRCVRCADRYRFDASRYRRSIERSIYGAAREFGTRLRRADVEDLVQDTLLILWNRSPARSPEAPSAYASRAARNVTADSLRKHGAKKRGARITVALDEVCELRDQKSSTLRAVLAREELQALMERCRGLLPKHTVQTLQLIFVQGLESTEAADRLGCSPSAVDTRVSRARLLLRELGIDLRRRQ